MNYPSLVLSEFYGADILQDVGYDVGHRRKRSRKRRRRTEALVEGEQSANNDTNKPEETEWDELKQFLDPNPQLNGTIQKDDHPRVSARDNIYSDSIVTYVNIDILCTIRALYYCLLHNYLIAEWIRGKIRRCYNRRKFKQSS